MCVYMCGKEKGMKYTKCLTYCHIPDTECHFDFLSTQAVDFVAMFSPGERV